ncbi:hypothetical protein EV122DRAFT_223963 [Schizophyllum commune]
MSSPLDFLKEFFEGNIDFVGQHYAEEAARSILIAGTVLSFFAGYFSQSMKVTFSALGSFVVLAAVVRLQIMISRSCTDLPPSSLAASIASFISHCGLRSLFLPTITYLPRLCVTFPPIPPNMNHHHFLDDQRAEWLTQPVPQPQPSRHSLLDASLELQLEIFGYCSPADLVNMRGVCKLLKKIVDDKPNLWVLARKGVCDMPPPPEGRTEWAWANRLCTGLLDSKINAREMWFRYKPAYKAHQRALMNELRELLQRLEPERCRLFECLRSPRFYHMFNTFLRDLKFVDERTLAYELPFVKRELGQIATCDFRQMPDGFQFEMFDRILCPLCNPDLAATREELLASSSRRFWFAKMTVQVDDLQDHYQEFHAQTPAPRLGIFTRCSHCDARPLNPDARFLRQTVYTAKRLRDHDRDMHVVVNPGRDIAWHATLSDADAAGP